MKKLILAVALIAFASCDKGETPDRIPEGGYEIVDSVWHIYTAEGMRAFAKEVNGDEGNYGTTTATNVNFELDGKLMRDIDLEGKPWTPIGWCVTRWHHGYAGTFDGGGNKISGLKIDMVATNYIGLFGTIMKTYDFQPAFGTIKNLTLVEPEVSGNNTVGAIVGYAGDQGSVENCNVVNGSVTGSGEYVGGIVGVSGGVALIACSNNAVVVGGKCVGGIVGNGMWTNIVACSNGAAVKGTRFVGGVVGGGSNVKITASYNSAVIEGADFVGGVMGDGYKPTIMACYNNGAVKGVNSVGGVLGSGYQANLKTNYWVGYTTTLEAGQKNSTAEIGITGEDTFVAGSETGGPAMQASELNGKVAELNAAIPETLTDDLDNTIEVNYKYKEGDVTPVLTKK